MGKGDKKTKKGKIVKGSYGVSRLKAKNKRTTEIAKPKVETKKKPAAKKTSTAKKASTKKKEV